MEGIEIAFDHDAGTGRMLLPVDAEPRAVAWALGEIDQAGYEELDATETGDPYALTDDGRMIIPLVSRHGRGD